MKDKEIAIIDTSENWSNLSPELDAAVDRAHAQVAAGQYVTAEEFSERMKQAIKQASERRIRDKGY